MQSDKFQVTGQWTPADQSANHLEVAETAEPGILALRDSFDPQRMIYTTPGQVRNFATAATRGPLQHIIEGQGQQSGGRQGGGQQRGGTFS